MSHTNPLDHNFDYTQWLNTVPSESPASAAGSSYNSVAPTGEPGTPNPYANPLANYHDSNLDLHANMGANQLGLFFNIPPADGMGATRVMGSALYPDQPVAARQDNVSINWAGAGAEPLPAAQMTTRDTFAPQAPNQGSSGGAYQGDNTGTYQSNNASVFQTNNANAYQTNNASVSQFNNAGTYQSNYPTFLQSNKTGNTAGTSARGFPTNNVGNGQSLNANTYQSLNASTYQRHNNGVYQGGNTYPLCPHGMPYNFCGFCKPSQQAGRSVPDTSPTTQVLSVTQIMSIMAGRNSELVNRIKVLESKVESMQTDFHGIDPGPRGTTNNGPTSEQLNEVQNELRTTKNGVGVIEYRTAVLENTVASLVPLGTEVVGLKNHLASLEKRLASPLPFGTSTQAAVAVVNHDIHNIRQHLSAHDSRFNDFEGAVSGADWKASNAFRQLNSLRDELKDAVTRFQGHLDSLTTNVARDMVKLQRKVDDMCEDEEEEGEGEEEEGDDDNNNGDE